MSNEIAPLSLAVFFIFASRLLKYFTFIDLSTIDDIMAEHRRKPERRNAQNVLARNVCKLVHGEEGLKSAERYVN